MAQQSYASAPTSDIGTPDLYWGTWGQGLLSEWWETAPQLIWPEAVITYGRMRHDPQIRGVLSAYKLPLLRATWALDPAGCRDEVVQLCSEDLDLPILTGSDVDPDSVNDQSNGKPARTKGVTWKRHLSQALQYLEFGHSVFERRYRIENDQLRLDALGERMPWTIARIMLNQDSTVNHLVQFMQEQPIPANRLVWYVHEHEGSNWAGFSLSRAAFGPWLLKHECWRVLATSIKRFGMGIPTVEAPQGATQGQVKQARDLASSMRVGDVSGVGLPAGFKFMLSGLTGSVPPTLPFIQYLDGQIAKQALAGLMDLGNTEHGSRALGETFLDLFLLSLQAVADEIAEIATVGWPGMPGILSDLVAWNWGADEPVPKVVCTDVGASYDITEDAINRLVQFGAIDPDPNLESWLRKRWGLPQRAKDAPSKIPPPSPEPVAPKPIPASDIDQAGDNEPSGPSELTGGNKNTEPGPSPEPAMAASAGGRLRAAGPPKMLRRALTPVEAAAGFDPLTIRQEWLDARTELVAAYKDRCLGSLRDALVDQVADELQAGRFDRLARLTTDMQPAVDLAQAAMLKMAQTAANRMRAEAAHQGVTIPASAVKLDEVKLGRIGAARCQLVGGYLAQQASMRALQVSAAAGPGAAKVTVPPMPEQIREVMQQFLDSLSDSSFTDQLGAALTAAQNAGRVAVLEAAAASGGTAAYVASEIEDGATCEACKNIDGTVFASLTDAESAYPSGGYIDCQGFLRCRGTVIAQWGGYG